MALTGAGISAESGLDTFRDIGGLWRRHRIEDVASPEGFARDPRLVHDFYNLRRRRLVSGEIHPNAAHTALVRLENEFTGDFLLVTQNVDDLHERAGSRNLIHMHGELLKARCTACGRIRDAMNDLDVAGVCDDCGETGAMRPHIVWFGEMPIEMDRIIARLQQCDLFLSIGTSGHVYPAAGFVDIARQAGARTIEVNLDHSDNADAFDESIHGRATEAVPVLVDELLTSPRSGTRRLFPETMPQGTVPSGGSVIVTRPRRKI